MQGPLRIDDIATAAVLGAGTMGHGIAQVLAQAGITVSLYDTTVDQARIGKGRIDENLSRGVDKGKISPGERVDTLARIHPTCMLDDAVAPADLVIEAVPEDLALKIELFRRVSEKTRGSTIVATNTSALSVTELARASGVPARTIGLHFFNPVHLMRLVEIVVGFDTHPEVVAASQKLVKRIGKEAAVVRDSPGFASSRLGICIAMEAIRMVETQVAGPQDIDRAMELGYNHPMGPLRLTDHVGLDVRLSIAEYLHREIGEQFRPPQLLRQMVRAGKLGKKTGEGFYKY
jgi:3-hydroxybutyryl-CoA dehydrogenase